MREFCVMWEVSHCTKTSELESRRLLKSPEDTPVSLWRPQFKNVAQEYSGILTEQLLAPRPNLPVHKRWWWKWDQKSWRPVWCTYLKMPSQTESDGCWGHNVHFGLTLLCFVLWSLGHLGEGETESPSSEMCLSQRGNEKINSSFFFNTVGPDYLEGVYVCVCWCYFEPGKMYERVCVVPQTEKSVHLKVSLCRVNSIWQPSDGGLVRSQMTPSWWN